MQIFTREQIRAWDEYTIAHEPIGPVSLMERASKACYDWLISHGFAKRRFTFFCAKGNNGGDGLALARMLSNSDHDVKVYILEFGNLGTEEFQANLVRLHQTKSEIKFISTEETIPAIQKGDVIIDALLGSGLNRPVEALTHAIVIHINNAGEDVIAIDIPSGLYADKSSGRNTVVHATHTLSFQCYKLAFLFAENEKYTGRVHILDIGLHPGFLKMNDSPLQTADRQLVRSLLKTRPRFSHKGNYGHAALLAGSRGMMGAAILCARAVLRTGAGKLSCHIPAFSYDIMQTSIPEAMSKVEEGTDAITSVTNIDAYQAVAIGPGLGKYASHSALLRTVFETAANIVADADALNIIAEHSELLNKLPESTVITPHPGEFARLFGKKENDFEMMHCALEKAAAHKIYIVLKGAYTFIATPSGKGYFNITGNPGMAKGGSGDVLTGIITALLSQGYAAHDACILGVYIHGVAGDLAALRWSEQSMIASDIVDHLGDAFNQLLAAEMLTV